MTATSTARTPSGARTGAIAIGGAVLGTVLVGIAAQLLDIELRVDPGNGQPPGVIGLPFAAAVALVVSLLGWGLRALLERVTRRAALVWTVLASAVLLLSFLPVLAVEATGGAKTILALMHVAVGVALLPVLGRRRS